ncbi:MAG: hypothetical protein Q9163_003545 [Psora crenata]
MNGGDPLPGILIAEGAKMLLGWLLDVDNPIDFAISSLCGEHDCVAVWAELIGSHKPAGSRRKDTYIRDGKGEDGNWMDEIREVEETRNVVHSAILDTLNNVNGDKSAKKEGDVAVDEI